MRKSVPERMSRRVDIRAILADPARRRSLFAAALRATQAREGRDIAWARAYEVVDARSAPRTRRGEQCE